MTKTEQSKVTKGMLRESHRRQFEGEDYQLVAIGIAEANGIAFESGDYTTLQSSPHPGCDCGFCATAEWQD
jgi:hypothetical protein